jgi:thiosulfate/3-mercaptopyruvate sulfurtransferase
LSHRPLIAADALLAALASPAAPVLLDCSFDLADPTAGERAFGEGHLPGARYVHLERDLSGAKSGRNGRHPLPDRAAFAERVGRWGIGPTTEVVVYDAQGGAFAVRAWWLLRWLGHEAVSLLDGGRPAFVAAGGALVDAPPAVTPRPPYPSRPPAMPTVDAPTLLATLGQATVLDARAGERHRGEVEPLDPVAGHIPGARHRSFQDNLMPGGRFKAAERLRTEFAALGVAPAEVVHHCGSGVTACHNLFAMELAGLAGSRLYPGSWSEWCADPARPVARG